MGNFYVKSGAGATEFAQSTAYSLGQKIVPKRSDAGTNFATARCAVWECTTAGTSAAAEPTWPAAITYDTTTVTSGTAVFKARKPGFSSGTTDSWAFATIYLDYLNNNKVGTGDTIFVSNNHAENNTVSAVSATIGAQCKVLCVDDSAAPPTALATTAVVQTTGEFTITIPTNNNAYYYGITFICGSTATGTRNIAGTGHFENCSFRLASTGGSSIINLIGRARNCTFKFAAAGQTISPGGALRIVGGSLLSGGTSPTNLFASNFARSVNVDGFDLSNASSTVNLHAGGGNADGIYFSRIKMPASWSGALGASAPIAGSWLEMHSVDNAGTNYVSRRKTNGGEAFSETTIVRTGGASDGVTGLSHKLVASSVAMFPGCSIETPWISKKNGVAGSAINVTVELVHDSVTALKDNECWLEVVYYSESGSPLGALVSSAVSALAAGSSLTSSSETWTTTGMSNPNKRKITVSFTPQQKGFVRARVCLAKASTTAYVCPKLALS